MAAGQTLLIFSPHANEPPTTNYATLDCRNQHPCLDYDGASNEDSVFTAVMPQAYDGGGVKVYLMWTNDGTAGDVDWDAAFERIADGGQDIDADGFAAVQSADNTPVPGVSGVSEYTFITFTDGAQMDSVAAGDLFRLKVTRDAVSDTNTDDTNLLAVEIRET